MFVCFGINLIFETIMEGMHIIFQCILYTAIYGSLILDQYKMEYTNNNGSLISDQYKN